MATGAGSSATPSYRHDSAAMFLGGGAAVTGSDITGEDAMWITVRRRAINTQKKFVALGAVE